VSPLLLLIGLSLTGAFAFGGLYVAEQVMGPGRMARRRVYAPIHTAPRGASILRENRSRLPFVERLPISATAQERTAFELTRAGMRMRPTEFLGLRLASSLGAACLAALAGVSLGQVTGIVLVLALGGMLGGWVLPRMYVSRRSTRRRHQIEDQLPEALTAIAKSLRAGSGLLQALAYAAHETPEPFGPELQASLRDLQLGAEPEEVFTDLARRVGSKDLDIVVTAILIQRSVGGNLAEILTNVSHTIRERVKLFGEVRVMTSKQKLMGNIIACIPVAVAVAVILMNPAMGDLLINTTIGRVVLVVAAGFELLGIFLMRRLAVIEV
jgi:tight adherence protein B